MFRIGIDSIEICRIEKSMRRESFIRRVFGARELAELQRRHLPSQSAAAAFAAKEAFAKAIGVGLFRFPLDQVELLHEDSGRPYLFLGEDALAAANGLSFDVSVTHTKTTATAVVIAWR